LPCVQDSAFLPVIMYDQTMCDILLFQACGCRHDISLDISALSLTRNYHTASPHAMDTTCHPAAGYLFVYVLVCAQYVCPYSNHHLEGTMNMVGESVWAHWSSLHTTFLRSRSCSRISDVFRTQPIYCRPLVRSACIICL